MNQKEINELRRRWRPDKNAISHIYGCFVSGNDKRIISDLEEPLSLVRQKKLCKSRDTAVKGTGANQGLALAGHRLA